MSDLKDIFSKWLDLSYNEVKKKIRYIEDEANAYGLNPNKFFLFVHSREPEEIDRFANDFNAVAVFIHRPGIELITSNHADLDVEDYNYDYFIENNGSLEDLRTKAKLFINAMRTGTNCYMCGHHVNEDKDGYCYCPLCDKIFKSMKYKEKTE